MTDDEADTLFPPHALTSKFLDPPLVIVVNVSV